MNSSKDKFLDDLINKPADLVVSLWILDRVPLIFDNGLEEFAEWRRTLAHLLEVDPSSIIITGSAAFGVSLNPHKNFRLFDESSDIDVAVVSDYHFTVAWRSLRRIGAERHGFPERVKHAIRSHVDNYIYWGTIATDKILQLMPFGKPWRSALDLMKTKAPTIGRTINARIYRDLESLRSYQANNLRQLQDQQLIKK